MLPFKNNNYFTLDNLSKMDISRQSLSVGIFSGLLQYFPINRDILVQKLEEEKKCQNSFPAILWLINNHNAILLGGGGGGGAVKKSTF